MATKLDVKNLRISFRTVSGKVQAVRDISFQLNKGETLAIVGESGSGKSVTSKAILGILAGNSIVEGGEIIYDGKDLLKIPEEEFYKIRGDKIAMIFQDPLSSLNPIMRIGNQLTEAMLLKGKARQKASRIAFNSYLKALNTAMVEACGAEQADKINKMCKEFDSFEICHTKLEQAYNQAYESATDAKDELENLIYVINKDALKEANALIFAAKIAEDAIQEYVVSGAEATELKQLTKKLIADAKAADRKNEFKPLIPTVERVVAILTEALAKPEPNFFSLGYYRTFSGKQPLPELPMDELNAFLRKYLDDNFMFEFIAMEQKALEQSAKNHLQCKKEVIVKLDELLASLDNLMTDESKCRQSVKNVCKLVEDSIDRLEIIKDSAAYVFGTSLESAVDTYYTGIKTNAPEEKRYAKEKAKFDKIVAKTGKEPDWKPTPAAVVDLELAKENIHKIIKNLRDHYAEQEQKFANRDFNAEAVAVIDFMKENASGVVDKVTKRMAKRRVIKLMEEVGIPEPRKRYRQYPFEFSGGMRQRIVIAIALAANPDILICDEPTTALDVTIQAQILELINRLKVERNLSIIFITHDLGVVANMADNIAVMYAGKIVEYGTSEEIFYEPAHPYTWALLASMPDLDTSEKLEAIPGTPPNMIYPPVGDAFADRNQYALKVDFEKQPPMFEISETHRAATWLLHPEAPKVEPPRIVTERIKRMKERGGNA